MLTPLMLIETSSYYEGINYKYKELKAFSNSLKEKFDLMCIEAFKEESGLCQSMSKFYKLSIKQMIKGHTYKPIKITGEVVQSSEWFQNEIKKS